MTERTLPRFEFQGPGRRQTVACFDGGSISSEGGVVLLAELDRKLGVTRAFSRCFRDGRDPSRIEHDIPELVRQRIYALCLGYEDLNDHEHLRLDPLLAAAVGKKDPTGSQRKRSRDQDKPLAGKSTMHRLEAGSWSIDGSVNQGEISLAAEAVEDYLVESFLSTFQKPPASITLDFDATDIPLYGEQEEGFFHGYYGHYCYLPLYVTCGSQILCARLRPSNIDASAGSLEVLECLVESIRARWPEVKILVRADSGFARDALMAWCEAHGVDFVFGLARNSRLQKLLEPAFIETEEACAESGEPERTFCDLTYRTLDSWSRERRVVGKAEITTRGDNPRFVVTSLPLTVDAKTLYEQIYCARGDMENRIKDQQLDLFAKRTSSHHFRVNQLRLWFSVVAYQLFDALRRQAPAGSELARARPGTLRLRLLKIGARIRVTVRKIWVSLASGHPSAEVFQAIYHQLQRAGPRIA